MGRPKGSKNKKNLAKVDLFTTKPEESTETVKTTSETNEKVEESIVTTETTSAVVAPKKTVKIVGLCDKCHVEIYSSPVAINLSHLTSKATWHRKCKLERICLCEKCASELNSMIDEWILKDNPDYYKFGVTDEQL